MTGRLALQFDRPFPLLMNDIQLPTTSQRRTCKVPKVPMWCTSRCLVMIYPGSWGTIVSRHRGERFAKRPPLTISATPVTASSEPKSLFPMAYYPSVHVH